jgi:hypothetical protein
MKTLFVTFTALAVLFVMGCQENSITDPLTSESANKIQIPYTALQGIIPLNGMLNDPYPIGNSYYIISGQIQYKFRKVFEEHGQATLKYQISLCFNISADLHYFCTVCSPSYVDVLAGFVQAESEDYFGVQSTCSKLLEKTFTIQGREDGMLLKCRFSVKSGRIELNSMWLALPPQIKS